MIQNLLNQHNDARFSGKGWQSSRAEAATVLGLTDQMLVIAMDARHAGPKSLATGMAELSRLQPKLLASFNRFRDVVSDYIAEEFTDGEGENRVLQAAEDAITIIGFAADNLITREGVQQVQDQIELLREQVLIMDRSRA